MQKFILARHARSAWRNLKNRSKSNKTFGEHIRHFPGSFMLWSLKRTFKNSTKNKKVCCTCVVVVVVLLIRPINLFWRSCRRCRLALHEFFFFFFCFRFSFFFCCCRGELLLVFVWVNYKYINESLPLGVAKSIYYLVSQGRVVQSWVKVIQG